MPLLKNWIDTYMEYVHFTESPKQFHRWCALCAISAALRRKVWFNLGRIKVYPNLYVVLVGEPGSVRKTQCISYMKDIVSDIQGIEISADAVTPEKLVQELENIEFSDQLPDGTVMRHNSIFIVSSEFEAFMGQKKDNSRMMVWLTDLFDCSSSGFRYLTKGSGSNTIKAPYITLLAATTPSSLSNSFPVSAIGGGLTSRMMFIWASHKEKKIPIPYKTEVTESLKQQLKVNLQHIARNSGPYEFTKEAEDWWINWYNNYDEKDTNRLCLDPSFSAWYSRKPLLLLKVAMILSAAQFETRYIHVDILEKAIEWLEDVEADMGNAFVAVGRSESSQDVDDILREIRMRGKVSEAHLIQILWKNMDMNKITLALEQCMKMGRVAVTMEGRKKFYNYIGG